MNLSIIIPLYNEEKLVLLLLEKLKKVQYPTFVSSVEVVNVDDASSDMSYSAVSNYIKNNDNNIKLFKHDINQ